MQTNNNNLLETLLFIALVIAFIVDRVIGWRLLGVAEVAFGVWVVINRRISYGIEGRPPAGVITGIPAIFIGLLTIALGIFFVFNPESIDMIFKNG
jgi:hypothetical protein